MSPNHLAERETHRARALADCLADVRAKLTDLESVQRAMLASGVEPRHVINREASDYLENWFFWHEKRALWRLRYPGPSGRRHQISEAKRRARLLHDVL